MGCGSSSVARVSELNSAESLIPANQPIEPQPSEESKLQPNNKDQPIKPGAPNEEEKKENDHVTPDGESDELQPASLEKSPPLVVSNPIDSSSSSSATSTIVPNEAQRAIAKSCDVSASALFTAASLETIPTLTLDPIDFDTPSSSFLGEIDIGLLIEYFTTGPCQLFSDATKMLEISQANLAELCMVTGSSEETLRLLHALDADGCKFEQMNELPAAFAVRLRQEMISHVGELSSTMQTAVLDAYDLLATHTCRLHPYAVIPTIVSNHHTDESDASSGGVKSEDDELDFVAVNTHLTSARMRLCFLQPRALVTLAHACGRDGRGTKTILQHLSLAEFIYDTPTSLIRACATHRLKATASVTRLIVAASTDSSASSSSTPPTPPQNLTAQHAPLEKALCNVEPTCIQLVPKLDPLAPTLRELHTTLVHLHRYLSRVLPLLRESEEAAQQQGLAPEQDTTTAEILRAYLIPFLKQLQPWLLQLRPYLSSLQPFFQDLQPFLGATHVAFTLLLPYLHDLFPLVLDTSAWLVQSPAFYSFAQLLIRVLVRLHPILGQLHPTMAALKEFMILQGVFLGDLQVLLDILVRYQTLPILPLEDADLTDAHEDEPSRSSIAIPWVRDCASEEEEDARRIECDGMNAPQLLAKYGRAIPKMKVYVGQLRPFANEVKEFVEKFVPFGKEMQ